MDIRLKKYSHSIVTKILVFIMVITCFTGAITVFVNTVVVQRGSLDIVFEDSYYHGGSFMWKSQEVVGTLTDILRNYKSEEFIRSGGTVTKEEIESEEKNLFMQFQGESIFFDPALSNAENYAKFKETYSDRISQIKERLIQQDLNNYNNSLQRAKAYEGIIFYASDGVNTITNSSNSAKDYFKSFPFYMLFDETGKEVYPKEIKDNRGFQWITSDIHQPDMSKATMYLAVSEEALKSDMKEWARNKAVATDSLHKIAWFLLGLALSFAYLVLITGRNSFGDKEVHLSVTDRLYNDVNILLCLGLITLWFLIIQGIGVERVYRITAQVTTSIAIFGLILVLSLVRHIKNRTIIKHSLVYIILYNIFKFLKDVYDSGSVGVKIVLIVVVYPILVAATFFMFPLTIGAAVWLAHRQIKGFNAIKEGVERLRNGEINHTIAVAGNGELGKLADNINGIAEGLGKAVDARLKSERLKTELITNVSHDIRTPLTSIITYIDLLKKEEEPLKASEYIEIIDQKAQRLKILTDDLFEAAKASSGTIPVNFERIDVVSLLTQGLGELNDKIDASELEFKVNHPKDKLYVKADGKLLWRALENLLSNIFKYALKGSRVYIDIQEAASEVIVTIKNISAYELNVSADELMERFKRGDEARSSQGSGLGLSIAKSLIDIQKGSFNIEIDGDLFKAIIKMPADKNS